MARGTDAPSTPPGPDLREVGERIDVLLDSSGSHGPVARERAEELVRLVTDLYGAGLERLLELLHESGHLADELLDRLARDDLVASLLLVHGLHPYDVETRVGQALDSVRPYLGSHGGDVELLGVHTDGTVRLRLLGSCDGCPSSSVTLTLAVETAIEAAAPEVTAIEVETPTADPVTSGSVIPVAALRSRLDAPTWTAVPDLAALPAGGVAAIALGHHPLVACRIGTDLFAFRDRCPRCESSLAGAGLARRLGGAAEDAVLRCPTCHAHFDVRRAGAGIDVPELHLEPLPLLADGTEVAVALPAEVVA